MGRMSKLLHNLKWVSELDDIDHEICDTVSDAIEEIKYLNSRVETLEFASELFIDLNKDRHETIKYLLERLRTLETSLEKARRIIKRETYRNRRLVSSMRSSGILQKDWTGQQVKELRVAMRVQQLELLEELHSLMEDPSDDT